MTIVGDASTDGTLQIARCLMYERPRVWAMHLPVNGRNMALRTGWSVSPAQVLAYMDIDHECFFATHGCHRRGPRGAPSGPESES
jgi:Glycosyl transferase family 2